MPQALKQFALLRSAAWLRRVQILIFALLQFKDSNLFFEDRSVAKSPVSVNDDFGKGGRMV
jgi:hypothetical protein